MKVSVLSRVRLFATPWTLACKAPLSMGFSRQEYCGGLPFPSPGDLPDPEMEPRSPASWADALLSELRGKQLITEWYDYWCWSWFNIGSSLMGAWKDPIASSGDPDAVWQKRCTEARAGPKDISRESVKDMPRSFLKKGIWSCLRSFIPWVALCCCRNVSELTRCSSYQLKTATY